jgi:drug/metabolite transporter (DMT)-like permease
MGGLGYVGQSFTYFTAITYVSVGLVALLLYLYPAIVAFFDVILFKEKMPLSKVIALVLAVSGAALTIGPATGGRFEGILLALAAAFIYSAYILAGSRLLRQADAIQTTTIIILTACVVYGLIGLFRGLNPPDNLLGWFGILGLSTVSTVLAVFTFMAGMQRIGPTNASALSTVEPVVTLLLAYWILGESITLLRLAGGALILGAVVLLARSEVRLARETSSPETALHE